MSKRSISIIAVLLLAINCAFAASPASKQLLTPPAFTVAPGRMQFFCFSAGNGENRVAGRWRASGGARNDIHVMLIDKEELENLRNGNGVPTYYNRIATTDMIDVNLRDGYYCLVFDNGASVVSNKAVTSDISGY